MSKKIVFAVVIIMLIGVVLFQFIPAAGVIVVLYGFSVPIFFRKKPDAPAASKTEVSKPEAVVPPVVVEPLLQSSGDHVNASGGSRALSGVKNVHGFKLSNVTVRTNLEKLSNFVAIDCETTGFNPETDSIVELAAVQFEDWEPTGEFHTLINPGRKMPKAASAVNHITDDMLVEAPSIDRVIPQFLSFIGKNTIVGHNVLFDCNFIQNSGGDLLSCKRRYYDTLNLVGRVLTKRGSKRWDVDLGRSVVVDDYDVENFKLGTLCEYYDVDLNDAHRALSDARATGYLFKKIVDDKLSRALETDREDD